MYSLLIHFYAFIVAMISPFHRKARLMRFGQWKTNSILREKIDRNAKYIWFHASSLGEFEQGRPMIEKVKAQYPEYKILLTVFSPSRLQMFSNRARPAVAVFIKYEFWGNYLRELKKRGIPVYIISAIFRPDQLFFQWFGVPYRKMLYCFTHLFVQDERSKELLGQYGIRNVTVYGDTRFDRVLDVRNQARELPEFERFVGERCQTLIAGSSWPQDEEILIPYFNEHPEMKLIIAPHEIHREHLMYIESLLKRPSVRLSDVMQDKSLLEGKDCLIVDSFGLLSSIYRYGTIAYIGGGFGAGIHNTLEAAVYGIPVLFGPRFQKFKEARDLIKVGGGFSVASKDEFVAKMDELLTYAEVLKAAGESAGQFVKGNAGATDGILKELAL